MTKQITSYKTCKNCGKTYMWTLVIDDGRDYMGHHKGKEKIYTVGYDCNCKGSVEKIKVLLEET